MGIRSDSVQAAVRATCVRMPRLGHASPRLPRVASPPLAFNPYAEYSMHNGRMQYQPTSSNAVRPN